MKILTNNHLSVDAKSQMHLGNKEKILEISVYASLIIVTITLMLLIFNLLLIGG